MITILLTDHELNLQAAKILGLPVFTPELKPEELYYYKNQLRIRWNPSNNLEQARLVVLKICNTEDRKNLWIRLLNESYVGSFFDQMIEGFPKLWLDKALVVEKHD